MTLTVTDNGDGTATISGATVTPSGVGVATVSGPGVTVVDFDDGSALVRATAAADGLTATADPDNVPPQVTLDITGMGGASVTIVRRDAAGNWQPVRTANPATLIGGAAVGIVDVEAPFRTNVTYVATSDTGATATSEVVYLDVDQPWLIHPGLPQLSQPLSEVQRGDLTYTANRGLFAPIGRGVPIARGDGTRQAPTFDLMCRFDSVAGEAALDLLLADSSPLLLQVALPDQVRTDYRWVSIGDVLKAELIGGFVDEPLIQYTLPCTTVDTPAGLQQAQWTWANVVATFSTWQDVIDGYSTWRDVITDTRTGT